jgi:putative mRNA 3-end processing factor
VSTEPAAGAGFTGGDDHPVELSYRHANPSTGNESILLRFGYEGRDGDACLLVDAGADVSVDRLLEPGDRLVGVCLTHAHLDHYRSLPSCLDEGVPVYASPATAAMADDVLDVASERYDVADRGVVADALVGVDDWTTVCPGVRLHPLPAGHAPGAVGFLVRFDDGDGHHDVVFTGDFTQTDCAGAPGFQTDLAADVELLFLTAATAPDPGDALTDALGDALERATAGGRALVTASGLTGVHVAALVAAANAELDRSVPVRLVGQTAKLYDALGYDHDAVETVPVFDDPRTCLTPGTVTIAGPEVPVADSSERLYGELKDDADAALVQLVTSGATPVQTGGCVSTHYELSMHPTESTLRAVVEDFDPVQTVLTHCRGTNEYNDLPTCVRSPSDDAVYDLYRDGSWCRPPWMSSVRRGDASETNRLGALAGDVFADLPLPSTDRASLPSLAAEGVDADRLANRLADRQDATDDSPDEAMLDDRSDDDPIRDDQPTTSTPDSDAMSDADTSDGSTDTELYRTAGADVDVEVPAEFEETLPSPNSIVSARARRHVLGTGDDTNDENDDETDGDGAPDETTPTADDREESAVDDSDAAVDSTAETEAESPASDDGLDATTTLDVELDPVLAVLLDRYRETTEGDRSPGTLVADAVEAYLGAVLREELVPTATTTTVSVSVDGLLGETLADAVAEAGFDDVDAAVRDALATTLAADVQTTVAADLGRCASLLRAVAETHDAFETQADVVEAAVERFLR